MTTETFKKIKDQYAHGNSPLDDFNQHRLMFTGYSPRTMAEVMGRFAPCLIQAYGTLFVDGDKGPAIVTAISDEGIRIEYITDVYVTRDGYLRDYEWLTTPEGLIVQAAAKVTNESLS